MQKAAIDYHGGELQAWAQEDVWTVRLGELEASSRYLDLALAELLDDAEGAHKLAARLLMELISTPSVTAAASTRRNRNRSWRSGWTTTTKRCSRRHRFSTT